MVVFRLVYESLERVLIITLKCIHFGYISVKRKKLCSAPPTVDSSEAGSAAAEERERQQSSKAGRILHSPVGYECVWLEYMLTLELDLFAAHPRRFGPRYNRCRTFAALVTLLSALLLPSNVPIVFAQLSFPDAPRNFHKNILPSKEIKMCNRGLAAAAEHMRDFSWTDASTTSRGPLC